MSTICEDVLEALVGADTTGDVSVVATESASAAASAAYAYTIGYDASSSASASAAALTQLAAVTTVVSAAAGVDSVTPAVTDAPVEQASASAAVALSRTLDVVESAAAAATAAPSGTSTQTVVSSARATSLAAAIVECDVESSGEASTSTTVVLDVGVTDTATAQNQRAPSAAVTQSVVVAANVSATPQAGLTAEANVTSSADARSAPVFAEGFAYWANSRLMASATWHNVPFTSYAMHDGALIATGPSGIYAFGADDDAGDPIAARVRGDLSDFGSAQRKVAETAYLSFIGNVRLTVATEDGAWDYDAPLTPERFASTAFDLGRGLWARYLRFELTNPDGAAFTLRDARALIGTAKIAR